jgi:hypothetical protein
VQQVVVFDNTVVRVVLAAFGIFSEYAIAELPSAADVDGDDDMDEYNAVSRRLWVVTGVDDSSRFWTAALGVMGIVVDVVVIVLVLATRERGAGEVLPILPPIDGRL